MGRKRGLRTSLMGYYMSFTIDSEACWLLSFLAVV